VDEEKKLKMAVISGASHALKFKAKNPRKSDEDAIQYVTREIESIIEKLGEEE